MWNLAYSSGIDSMLTIYHMCWINDAYDIFDGNVTEYQVRLVMTRMQPTWAIMVSLVNENVGE